MTATVPLSVGTANLGLAPRSSLGDTTLEQNVRDFYRKNSGRWNRLNLTIAAGATVKSNQANSGNVKVSNVILFAYPVVPGGTVDVFIWETTSGAGTLNGDTQYHLGDTLKQEYPGLDDRTYWQIQNNAIAAVRVSIYYQEAGTA